MSNPQETQGPLEFPEAPLGYPERLAHLIERAELDPDLHPVALEALEWYSDDLPYHNTEHMFEVAERVLELCEQKRRPSYAKQALFMAALWHDAAYPLPLEPYEKSKEHRSALLAHEAIMHGRPADDLETLGFADYVARLILSTQPGHVPQDEDERILNDADLGNIQGENLEMLAKSGAVYVENLMLAGEALVGSIEDVISQRHDDFMRWCDATQTHLTGMITTKFSESQEFLKAKVSGITFENVLSALRIRRKSDSSSE